MLLANRHEQKQDLRPVAAASIEDLDGDSVGLFPQRVREIETAIFSSLPDENVLLMLNVADGAQRQELGWPGGETAIEERRVDKANRLRRNTTVSTPQATNPRRVVRQGRDNSCPTARR